MDWLFKTPLQFLIFPVALAGFVYLAFKTQPAAGRIDDFGRFARAHLKATWRRTLAGALVWFFKSSLWGLGVYLGAWLIGRFNPRSKERARLTTSAAELERQWLDTLGATPEARTKTINRLFDKKEATLSMAVWYEFKDRDSSGHLANGYVGAKVSRNLAAMDTREREFLRIVELLRHVTDSVSKGWYDEVKVGLVWGNGKGSLDEWSYLFPNPASPVQDGVGAMNWYAGQRGISVDSAINATLKKIVEKEAELLKRPELAPVIRQIKGRVSGGGGWLSPEDSTEARAFAPNGSAHALRLGTFDDGTTPLHFSGEGSIITIAPPGSGKTQCNVFPNLLEWRGPAVVLDVKGEIYAGTSKWRADHVGPVFKFSPLDPAKSHRYNPLSFVRSDPDYIWEDSRFLADMMIVPQDTGDRFWQDKARDLLTAAIAHVCFSAPPDKRPLSHVVDIVHGGKPFDEMLVGLQTAVEVRAMVQQGTSLAGMNERTRDSVLQTAQASMSAWSGERIARATQASDWSPLDLRGGKNPTVYICLRPSEVEGYLSLLRVFIAQHIRMLTYDMPSPSDPPILFLLDELPRLRHMPPVEEALDIGRAYKIKLWMFAQSLGQLEQAYPNATGMVGSCAVRIFMNPSAHDGLAEKLSQELGFRESAIDGTRQRLVEAADLAGADYRDYQIVIAASAKPAKIKKAFAWEDPAISARMGSL